MPEEGRFGQSARLHIFMSLEERPSSSVLYEGSSGECEGLRVELGRLKDAEDGKMRFLR